MADAAGAAATSEAKRPAVFVKVEELRPGTSGHNLAVKVVNHKLVLQRALPDGRNARQLRIAECIVGDATGVIVFTAPKRARSGAPLPVASAAQAPLAAPRTSEGSLLTEAALVLRPTKSSHGLDLDLLSATLRSWHGWLLSATAGTRCRVPGGSSSSSRRMAEMPSWPVLGSPGSRDREGEGQRTSGTRRAPPPWPFEAPDVRSWAGLEVHGGCMQAGMNHLSADLVPWFVLLWGALVTCSRLDEGGLHSEPAERKDRHVQGVHEVGGGQVGPDRAHHPCHLQSEGGQQPRWLEYELVNVVDE